MSGTHRRQLVGALAIALLVSEADAVRAQSGASAETGSALGFEDAETSLEASPEGGLFELLQPDGGTGAALVTGKANVFTIPVGEPEDRLPIYRTMCVRLCDGYYFPMSPSSSRNDFARDQQNCESICPGATMRTYYQLSGEQDVDAMMSAATDDPYRELANAYLYRRADAPAPPLCGCGMAATGKGYFVLGGESGAAISQAPGSSFVYSGPPAEPEPADDPPADVGALLRPTRTDVHPSGERRVRVVGPEYLPGQAAAGTPPVPVPTTGR